MYLIQIASDLYTKQSSHCFMWLSEVSLCQSFSAFMLESAFKELIVVSVKQKYQNLNPSLCGHCVSLPGCMFDAITRAEGWEI